MGAWGTAISSNDTYADIYGEFFDLYDDGLDISEISAKLVEQNQETINDPDDASNFWFALAKAQWECKQLDPAILDRVEQIIVSGSDIAAWRRLDSSEKDLRKRESALKVFLEKLRSEKPKPRARKKKIIRQPIFEKGDCLAFRLEDGNYGGCVILEAVAMVGFGLNLVATTGINQSTPPSVSDCREAEVLTVRYPYTGDEAAIGWNYSTDFKKDEGLFAVIGKIDISKQFDPNDYSFGFGYRGGWKIWIIDVASKQFTLELIQAKSKKLVRIKDFMANKWNFW